mgnify:FL=1
MQTKLIKENISEAAEIIKRGGLVAVPTETVYGLAGNGLDENAVHEIYEVKGRPAVKPLSLMVPDRGAMKGYCEDVPEQAEYLAERFWPGPLTIVLKAKELVPEIVRAGGTTVGLRCPDHPLTLEALRLAKLPFAAPSANPSGAESPKDAAKVMEYFSGRIDAVIDGGPCGIGRESTLIDMSARPYRILRQGALAADDIADALVDNMKIIGITGGTGCGKTTALETLKDFGALVIDCDALYHELLESSAELINEIDKYFPGAVTDGVLDRKALGAVVFTDEEALRDLNIITHRYIHLELRRRLREWAMQGGTLAAVDAIELFSSGIAKRCCATVGVIADREVRLRRIQQRDGISLEYAMMRVNAQRPNEYFEEHCDYILQNNGTREEFSNCCLNLFLEVLNK